MKTLTCPHALRSDCALYGIQPPLQGWSAVVEGDTARIVSPPDGPGFLTVHAHSKSLAERMLYALAVRIAG